MGEWGSGEYTDVAIYGNHAFLLAPATGLDIMDISNPSFPTKVAAYRPPLLSGSMPTSGVLHLEGSTAYIFLFDWGSEEGVFSPGTFFAFFLFFSVLITHEGTAAF